MKSRILRHWIELIDISYRLIIYFFLGPLHHICIEINQHFLSLGSNPVPVPKLPQRSEFRRNQLKREQLQGASQPQSRREDGAIREAPAEHRQFRGWAREGREEEENGGGSPDGWGWLHHGQLQREWGGRHPHLQGERLERGRSHFSGSGWWSAVPAAPRCSQEKTGSASRER